jgi:hypothetical protein
VASTSNMSPEVLQGLVKSLERSINEIAPPRGALPRAGWHIRRYMPFYALLVAWVLLLALVPINDRSPAAAPAAAPGVADTSPSEATLEPGGTSGPARSAGALGSTETGGPAGGPQDIAVPVIEAAPPEENDGDGDGEGSGGIDPGDVEDSLVQQLAPIVTLAQQFYDEVPEAWDLANTVIGAVAPTLVDVALALGPGVAILAAIGGGDLREACMNLGLAGTAYGAIVAPALPPVNIVALLLPAFIVCGFVFEEVDEDEPAPVTGIVDGL